MLRQGGYNEGTSDRAGSLPTTLPPLTIQRKPPNYLIRPLHSSTHITRARISRIQTGSPMMRRRRRRQHESPSPPQNTPSTLPTSAPAPLRGHPPQRRVRLRRSLAPPIIPLKPRRRPPLPAPPTEPLEALQKYLIHLPQPLVHLRFARQHWPRARRARMVFICAQ